MKWLAIPYLMVCSLLINIIQHPSYDRAELYERARCQSEDVKGRQIVMLARKWSVWPSHETHCYPIIQYAASQSNDYEPTRHDFTMNYAFIVITDYSKEHYPFLSLKGSRNVTVMHAQLGRGGA